MERVCGEGAWNDLFLAAGPKDGDALDGVGTTEAKGEGVVGLGEVVDATSDRLDLCGDTGCFYFYGGSYAKIVVVFALESDLDPVIFCGGDVAKDRGAIDIIVEDE